MDYLKFWAKPLITFCHWHHFIARGWVSQVKSTAQGCTAHACEPWLAGCALSQQTSLLSNENKAAFKCDIINHHMVGHSRDTYFHSLAVTAGCSILHNPSLPAPLNTQHEWSHAFLHRYWWHFAFLFRRTETNPYLWLACLATSAAHR